jgi:hypothetical protein
VSRERITVVGTFAVTELLGIEDSGLTGYGQQLRNVDQVVGNDAVIVARLSAMRGLRVTCILLNPTVSDLELARNDLPTVVVRAITPVSGGLSRSWALERADGSRHWLFSRLPEPVGAMDVPSTDYLYLDAYPELLSYLTAALPADLGRLVRAGVASVDSRIAGDDGAPETRVFVNLSANELAARAARVAALRPCVVQASGHTACSTLEEAAILARKLAALSGADFSAVTLGAEGAALATSSSVMTSQAPVRLPGRILGAGATFSACLLSALVDGADEDQLLGRAMEQTARELNAWCSQSTGRSGWIGTTVRAGRGRRPDR